MKITNPKFVSHKIKFMREKVLTPIVSGDFLILIHFLLLIELVFYLPVFRLQSQHKKKTSKISFTKRKCISADSRPRSS